MGKRQLPEWVPGTMREFRARKRSELRALQKALDTFRIGCAYTPLKGAEVRQLTELVNAMRRKLSVKEWR